jgi:hypothetical protein
MLILHFFWLSLATYRVRVAFNLKRVAFEERAHDLTQGEQKLPEFQKLNPAMSVSADAQGRAKVRALFCAMRQIRTRWLCRACKLGGRANLEHMKPRGAIGLPTS